MKFGILAIVLILVLIQRQFHNLVTTMIIGSGVLVALAGGFIMIWFYNQPWFLDLRLGDLTYSGGKCGAFRPAADR